MDGDTSSHDHGRLRRACSRVGSLLELKQFRGQYLLTDFGNEIKALMQGKATQGKATEAKRTRRRGKKMA